MSTESRERQALRDAIAWYKAHFQSLQGGPDWVFTPVTQTANPLPNPGSPEASAMIDSVLAEYNWPSNMKNAARAGYVAATRLLANRLTEGEDREPMRSELIDIARSIESLKRECGMDPESPTAIHNGALMSVAYRVRALANREAQDAALTPSQREAARAVVVESDKGRVFEPGDIGLGKMTLVPAENIEALRRALRQPGAQDAARLTDEQWIALAERHACADWNSDKPDGYLRAVRALCADFAAIEHTIQEKRTDRPATVGAFPRGSEGEHLS